ncbi:hypothetical protein DFH11DRAFT_1515474, partial [Phellopilus nigrolimitatus]
DAVPPFYMLSFELGGIGMTDYLGSDPQNLTYVVRHAQGLRPDHHGFAVDKSSQVNTCDELAARINGGTKPYTVTVVGASPTNFSITNYTLGAEDD